VLNFVEREVGLKLGMVIEFQNWGFLEEEQH
jgi:hypothetical protein